MNGDELWKTYWFKKQKCRDFRRVYFSLIFDGPFSLRHTNELEEIAPTSHT